LSCDVAVAVVGLAQFQLVISFWKRLADPRRDRWRRRGCREWNARRLERLGELERRLAARKLRRSVQELAVAALDLDQLDHVLGRQRSK